MSIHGLPGTCEHSFYPQPATADLERANTLIGLAGEVAEYLAAGDDDAEDIAVSIEEAISAEGISQTDVDMMGEWSTEHVAQVVDGLLQNWDKVILEAGWLEENARNSSEHWPPTSTVTPSLIAAQRR